MENISSSYIPDRQDLICPITLCLFHDPVRAGDGHVYERNAIIQWIEQQGTSPLTRQPLNVNDLCSEDNIKQLCQSYRSNVVTYSCRSSTISLPSAPIIQPSAPHCEQRISWKQDCSIKRILIIIIAICFIASPFIIGISIIFCLRSSNSISSIASTTIQYSKNETYPFITDNKIPNNCTLSKIVPLFSWNNVQTFNYTHNSKLYKAVSTQTLLTFVFQHGTSYWCIDDISVVDLSSKTELVKNGNFENDPSDGFIRCNSQDNSLTTLSLALSNPYNGKRSFCTGTKRSSDYVCQRLNTKIGQIYRVSFWLRNTGDAPNNAQVLMSY